MAIDFNQQDIKQKKFPTSFVLIVVVLIILGIFLYRFLSKPKEENISQTNISTVLKKFNIDFNILQNPIFSDLKNFEKTPPLQGEPGRENPFNSY